MSFQEDFEEFLDVEQGFAVIGKVMPAQGKSYLLKGIFVNEYIDIDAGMAGIAGSNPTFECAEEDGMGIEFGDFLRVKGIDYRVIGLKADGCGWLVIELERQ